MSGKLEPILETDAAPSAMVKRRVVDEAGSSGDGPEIPPAEAAAAARMDEHVPSGADAAPVVVVDDAAAKAPVVDDAAASGVPHDEAPSSFRGSAEHVRENQEEAKVTAAAVAAAEAAAAAAGSGSGPEVRRPPESGLSSASSLIAAVESNLTTIVKNGLGELATNFTKDDAGADPKKLAAAAFIQKLNEYVQKPPAAGGGSRRALKRIMKKYSRRVSRSRRQRGKRVKQSAQ